MMELLGYYALTFPMGGKEPSETHVQLHFNQCAHVPFLLISHGKKNCSDAPYLFIKVQPSCSQIKLDDGCDQREALKRRAIALFRMRNGLSNPSRMNCSL